MKYLVNLFVILFLIFNINISKAETKIVYINMDKLMNETKAGKSINLQLEKLHKMNIKEFKKIEDQLKKEESQIIAQKNILSKEDYSNKIQNLRNRANEYRKSRQEKINSLTKKRIDASSELLSSINPILSEYSKNNGISIILPKKNVVIAKTNLDITDQIIELTNSKIDQISLK